MKTEHERKHWLKTVIVPGLIVASTLAALANPTLPTIPSGTFNITSYGASTSSANNAAAIQSAIAAAGAAGGGTVEIPAGTFLSGPIVLTNSLCLNIASGAILRMLPYGTYPGSTTFIDMGGLNNVKINGTGAIDGQGAPWWAAYNASNSLARPGMISGNNTTISQVSEITLSNAPNVHVSFHYTCNDITINNITINAPSTSPNTDGVDLEGSNFYFANDNIADGDDNIAIVASHVESDYIVITNCTFGVGHGCSIGSYTSDQVNHLTVQNCTFNGGGGIRMKSSNDRGGVCQYLTYTGITMTGVATPIWLSEWYPSDPSDPVTAPVDPLTSTTPNYKHILIQNLTATGASSGYHIYGRPEQHISDVTLDNVKITATTGMDIYYADGIVFTNGSTINVSSGNQVTVYDATVSGISTNTY